MTNSDIDTVDLARLGKSALAGRALGACALKRFDIDELSKSGTIVSVIIPKEVTTITSSFFLGMFGDAIRHAGSEDNFRTQFHFNMPPHLYASLTDAIERALRKKQVYQY